MVHRCSPKHLLSEASEAMESLHSSGFSSSAGVYYSLWQTPDFPHTPLLDYPSFLLLSLQSNSSIPAFIDAKTGTKIMYSDLPSLTNRIASALHSLGIRKGDVVLIISPNFLYYPLLMLAIMSLGAIVSPINPLCLRDEVESQTKDSNPKLIFTTVELKPKFHGLLAKPLILLEPFMEELLKRPADMIYELPPGVKIKQSDTAMLAYSSGTTGKSKGVLCSHGNFISMACILRSVWSSKHEGREVYLCVLPLFHMYGMAVFITGLLSTGACAVIARKYVLEDVLACVDRFAVTRLPLVPPMIVQLLSSQRAKNCSLSSLKEVCSSGASLEREFMIKFTNAFPKVVLTQMYGLTETSGPMTLCDGVDGRFHISIGRLSPSVEARIVDIETGRWLPPGGTGELWLKGPTIMHGYFQNEQATSEAMDRDGWLRTGDICVIDDHGLVYIVGRIKELIKYKAYQVAPVELEEILGKHEAVEDCAVIPYPDKEAGEIPTACIVRKPLNNLKEQDITIYMANKVAPYKRIRKVIFVDHIPRSPSGKILRKALITSVLSTQLTTSKTTTRLHRFGGYIDINHLYAYPGTLGYRLV
ncbi:4-coumarate--CoA ligase-like 5 [Nymphaea colorata]|nr:4-coumarate--CoA ligase-like 5 [Nymphaea colorata]